MYQVRDKLTKNRRENNEAEEGGFMYERQGDSHCPVKSFQKYLAHLNPRCDASFQRPKKEAGCEEVWYDNRMNTLKDISKQASREYTNHSIRATSVTLLDECGFEARHIMCVSGHRSESSIRSYASKTTDKLKFAMSTGLSSALCDETGLSNAVCDETGLLCVEPESSAVNQPLQEV